MTNVSALRHLSLQSSDDRRAKVGWKVVSVGTGLLSGFLTRLTLNWAWKHFAPSDHDPPLNPADRRISWGEAVIWSVAAGVGVGVARVISDRLTAEVWELATGDPPPGVKTD
jgi:hypothetical protein